MRAGVRAELILLRTLSLLLLCLFAEATLVRRVRVARPHFVVAGRAPVGAMDLRACNRAGHKTFVVAVDWSTVGPPNLGAHVLASLDASACRRCVRSMRVRAGAAPIVRAGVAPRPPVPAPLIPGIILCVLVALVVPAS